MRSTHFDQGTFFVGCNYWASHAGMHMWHDWDASVVEDDFRRLSEARVTTLRVFPLWSDFQPLRMHFAGAGVPREIRMNEDLLPFTEAGRAGVDEVMVERFQVFCDLAEKYGLKLIVGLLTGWMSGRLFVPEMLQERNVLKDPFALKWEIKYVRYMVKRFREHPAILAWNLGNECNCLAPFEKSEEMYVWASTISMAIRCGDPVHKIVSGMHGMRPEGKQRPQDQAEFLDVLTTHPYPIFVEHCDTDPLINMKSALHAAAESQYYADLGGIPCFAEEVGVLGPMMISDEYAADYIRAMMLTLVAHDCLGMCWWCGFEQSALTDTPYDWNGVERELGLFYLDKTKKPVLKEITNFSEFIEKLPVDHMPERMVDAVCILNPTQDTWGTAYGAFIMAKQAGVDLKFAYTEDEIPEAKAYLLPNQTGDASLTRHVQQLLAERVRRGAKLYISMDGPLMSPFTEWTGLRVMYRGHMPHTAKVTMDGTEITMSAQYKLWCESAGAEVLAKTDDGRIAFAKNAYGEGEVYTLLYPAEMLMASVPGMTDSESAQPMYKFYEKVNMRSAEKVAAVDLPTVGLSEHILSGDKRCLMVINYEPFDQTAKLTLADGWKVAACYSAHDSAKVDGDSVVLPHNDGAVIFIEK